MLLDAHILSSPAVVEWVHNMGNKLAPVVLVGESVLINEVALLGGTTWVSRVGDELKVGLLSVNEVVVEDEVNVTVVMSMSVMVFADLLEGLSGGAKAVN